MIAVKSILVPTDFSETSDAALNDGIGLVPLELIELDGAGRSHGQRDQQPG